MQRTCDVCTAILEVLKQLSLMVVRKRFSGKDAVADLDSFIRQYEISTVSAFVKVKSKAIDYPGMN